MLLFDVRTNEVIWRGEDVTICGVFTLPVTLSYRSGETSDGPLGFGWKMSADLFLSAKDQTLELRCGNESLERFEPAKEPGTYTGATSNWQLQRGASAWFAFEDPAKRWVFQNADRKGTSIRPSAIIDGNGNTLRLTHDDDRLTQLLDPSGANLRFVYSQKRLAQIVHTPAGGAAQRIRTFSYNLAGDLVELTDAVGQTHQFGYVDHKLVDYTSPGKSVRYAQYDALNRCVRVWDRDKSSDRIIQYDDSRQTVRVIHQHGDFCLYRRATDEKGQTVVMEKVFPSGNGQSFLYDKKLSLIGFLSAHGNVVTVQNRDQDAGSVIIVDAEDTSMTVTENALGQTVAVEAASGAAYTSVHDPKGNPVEINGPLDSGWKLAVGKRGFVETFQSPGSRSVSLSWSPNLVALTTADAIGKDKRVSLDGAGRILQIQAPDGVLEERSYDPAGKLTFVASGEGMVQIQYDRDGRIIGFVDESRKKISLERDAAGRIIRLSRRDGVQITVTYNPDGSVAGMGDGRWSVKRSVDKILECIALAESGGTQIRAERVDDNWRVFSGSGEEIWTTNPAAELVQIDRDGETIRSFTRDGSGNLFSSEILEIQAASMRNEMGFLSQVAVGETFFEDVRDLDGRLVSRTFDATLEHQFQHDARGRLVRAAIMIDGQPHRYKFLYTASDRPSMIVWPDGRTTGFKYDNRGRCTALAALNTDKSVIYSVSIALDPDGYPKAFRDSAGAGIQASFDPAGRLVAFRTPSGLTQLSFDAAGRPVGDSRGMRLTWSDGRVSSCNAVSFGYDKNGRRVEESGPESRRVFDYNDVEGSVSIRYDDGRTINLQADALGRWIQKWNPLDEDDERTHFIWDETTLVGIKTPEAAGHFLTGNGKRLAWFDGSSHWAVIENQSGDPVRYYPIGEGEATGVTALDPFGLFETGGNARLPVLFNGWLWDDELALYLCPGNLYDPVSRHFLWPDERLTWHGKSAYSYEPTFSHRFNYADWVVSRCSSSTGVKKTGIPDRRLFPNFGIDAWSANLAEGISHLPALNAVSIDPDHDPVLAEPHRFSSLKETGRLEKLRTALDSWTIQRQLLIGIREADLIRLALL